MRPVSHHLADELLGALLAALRADERAHAPLRRFRRCSDPRVVGAYSALHVVYGESKLATEARQTSSVEQLERRRGARRCRSRYSHR